MTHPEPRSAQAAVAAAIALASLSCVFAPRTAAAADSSAPKSAADCRAIADFALRGQCWDALVREGLHDQQVIKKRDFGLGAAAPAVAAIKVPKRKVDSTEIRALTLTIASVTDTARGRIILTATDGAVWEVTDTDPLINRPSPGDTFQVHKGMMDGYFCQVTRWQSLRCQRDE